MIVNVVMGPYATPSTAAVDFRVTGDAYPRIAIDAAGKIIWGGGTVAGDADLYRSAVGILTLDGALVVVGNVTAANLIAPKVSFPTGQIYVLAGTAYFRNLADSAYIHVDANNVAVRGILTIGADTNLYRSGADALTTDDALTVVGNFTAPKVIFAGLGQIYASGTTVYFRNLADSSYISIDVQNASVRGTLTIGADTTLYRAAADILATDDDLAINAVGKGLKIKEGGAAAKMGVATLVGGTVVVATTAVTANSRILLTGQSLGTVVAPSALTVSARTPGTSFTILASQATDTSDIAWHLIEPA